MEIAVNENDVAKIHSILLSHPEGLMAGRIKELGGFANVDVVYSGLRALESRGKAQEVDPFRYVPQE